uniref:Uncharacterized protein n=1 Tax=Panagrolaimus sp. ES5 TaxID=591445 RepID=A0AC34FF87_9BILA
IEIIIIINEWKSH